MAIRFVSIVLHFDMILQWRTFSLVGPYETFCEWLKLVEGAGPAHYPLNLTGITSSIAYRLLRMRSNDDVLQLTLKHSPTLIVSELHRLLTLSHWIHMDYQ